MKLSRPIFSMPLLHRTETLRAIASKTHALTEEIHFLKTEGHRINQLLQNVPEHVDSRLTWLASQLNQI